MRGVRATQRRSIVIVAVLLAVAVGLGVGTLALRNSGSPGGTEAGPNSTPPPDATCATQRGSSDLQVGTSIHREPGESYEQAWQRRVTTWQVEPEMARYYYPELPVGDWPEFGDAHVMASFKLPVVNGQVDVAGLLDGAHDKQLTEWFASMPNDGTPKYVAFWHEPEDDVAIGQFTSTEFRQAFEHVRALATQFDDTERNIRVGVVLMGWTANPASGRDVADYLPPRASFVGWDIYTLASEQDTWSRFALAAEESCDAGIPQWFLAETAIRVADPPTPTETAQWIPMAADAARGLGYSGLLYFDSTVGGDFRLTSRQTWQAMNRGITRN